MLKLSIPGLSANYTDETIESISEDSALSLTGEELSIDELTVAVRNSRDDSKAIMSNDGYYLSSSDGYELWTANSKVLQDPMTIPYHQTAYLYENGVQVGVWYFESIKQTGACNYELTFESLVGVFDDMTCGGVGVWNGISLEDALSYLNISGITVESKTAEIKVYGYLWPDTMRNNLARLMLATNTNLIKTDKGECVLTSIIKENPKDIADDYVFMDGDATPQTMVSTVTVNEYSYAKSLETEPEIVYSGPLTFYSEWTTTDKDGFYGSIWVAEGPMSADNSDVPYYVDYENSYKDSYDVGYAIYSNSPNKATLDVLTEALNVKDSSGAYLRKVYVLSLSDVEGLPSTAARVKITLIVKFKTGYAPTASDIPNVEIKARPYVVSKVEQTYQSGSSNSTGEASIADCGLISSRNSQAIAKRIINASATTEVSVSIINEQDTCGNFIRFTDAFGTKQTGYIVSADTTRSTFTKSSCKVLSNFAPVTQITDYTGSTVLKGSGIWEIPSSVFEKSNVQIRVIIIGGAQAGYDGENGEDGATYTGYSRAKGGAGGKGGKGGSGGKIYETVIDCTGLTSFSYSCGAGGASNGAYGEDTTFGTYSSGQGSTATAGIVNEFNGYIYGLSGADGQAGGAGGDGGVYTPEKSEEADGTNGEDVTDSATGLINAGGEGSLRSYLRSTEWAQYTSGAGGGGASAGGEGGYAGNSGSRYWAGVGADGTSLWPRTISTTAGGGAGGNGGGGGGGACGMYYVENYDDGETSTTSLALCKGGKGGAGEAGTAGGDGLILIYY